MSNLIDEIRDECNNAHRKYGAFTSSHEGYGVLCEEVAELLDAIRENNAGMVRSEALQVAAVALRIADCCDSPSFRERSGM